MAAGIKSRVGSSPFEIDMTEKPFLGKLLKFSIPLALSGVLQLMFNAVDMVVAGRFAGNAALAAIGATSPVIQLLINLFVGLSVGVNVMTARFYGARQAENLEETVHTAVLTAVLSGILLTAAGAYLSRQLLELMGTPPDILEQSVRYMRFYFLGMPAMMLYNYGAAILRAVGDTRRALYILLAAGVINLILNLISVIVWKMGVTGVALATVISQCVSAGAVLLCLIRSDVPYHLNLRHLRIVKDRLWEMVKIGVPAGIQGAAFSISKVLIQSSINSFGTAAVAGSTAGGNIEGFVYTAMDSFTQAALSFISQNCGAKRFENIRAVVRDCLLLATGAGLVLGCGVYAAGQPLLGIYTSDPEVIHYGMVRMLMMCVPYCICGVMNVLLGAMRGMGSSVMPMAVSIFGVCVLRVVWIYTVFALRPTFEVLFFSYPATWVITTLIEIPCYAVLKRRTVSYSRIDR